MYSLLFWATLYDFLFIFNRNYAPVLYRFWDTLSYLLKFTNFSLPHLHLASPVEGDCVRISKRFLASENYRVNWLSWGVVCVILHLSVLVERQLVTDTHTDRQTHGHGIYHAEHSSRGNKTLALTSIAVAQTRAVAIVCSQPTVLTTQCQMTSSRMMMQ